MTRNLCEIILDYQRIRMRLKIFHFNTYGDLLIELMENSKY